MSGSGSRRWPFVVGLTGGIASGKSLAAHQFASLGAEVIDTDVVARQVVAPGSEGLAQIRAAFGSDVVTEDGELDREAMRRRIFLDPNERQRLEAITHPLIEEHVTASLDASNQPYVVLVVPLLLERGWQRLTDRVAVVDCPREDQRRRLWERDGTPPDDADRILASQASRNERLAAADDVIVNNATPEALRDQVGRLDTLYRREAASLRS